MKGDKTMIKITRTIVFLLVLGGLLTWGMSTLAQAPITTSSVNHVQLEGQTLEGVPVSRDLVRPVGQ